MNYFRNISKELFLIMPECLTSIKLFWTLFLFKDDISSRKLMFSSYRNQSKYLIRKSIDYQVSIWWQHWFLMSRLDLVYSSLSRISAEERCGAVLPRHLISKFYIRAQFSRTTKSSLINELKTLKSHWSRSADYAYADRILHLSLKLWIF